MERERRKVKVDEKCLRRVNVKVKREVPRWQILGDEGTRIKWLCLQKVEGRNSIGDSEIVENIGGRVQWITEVKSEKCNVSGKEREGGRRRKWYANLQSAADNW